MEEKVCQALASLQNRALAKWLLSHVTQESKKKKKKKFLSKQFQVNLSAVGVSVARPATRNHKARPQMRMSQREGEKRWLKSRAYLCGCIVNTV